MVVVLWCGVGGKCFVGRGLGVRAVWLEGAAVAVYIVGSRGPPVQLRTTCDVTTIPCIMHRNPKTLKARPYTPAGQGVCF